MGTAKVSDASNAPWWHALIPLTLTLVFGGLQLYMIKPAFGAFVARHSWPFALFMLLLALWLDDIIPRLYVFGPRIYGLFIPLYIGERRLWKAYRYLPYVWDAQFT